MKDYGIGALEIALGPHGPPAGPPVRAPAAACATAPVQQGGQGALSARRTLLALAIIVVGGVSLRMYGLYGRSMWFDEGFSGGPSNFPSGDDRANRTRQPPSALLHPAEIVDGGLRGIAGRLAEHEPGGERFGHGGDLPLGRGGVRPRRRPCEGAVDRAGWGGAVRGQHVPDPCGVGDPHVRNGDGPGRGFDLAPAPRLFAPVQRWGAWAAYAAAALAFAYTHYYALYSLVGQAVFAVGFLLVGSCAKVGECFQEGSQDASTTIAGRRRRDACTTRGAWRRTVAAYAVVAVGWAPWLPTFLRQKEQVASDFWSVPFTLRDVYRVCYEMFFSTELVLAAPAGPDHRRLGMPAPFGLPGGQSEGGRVVPALDDRPALFWPALRRSWAPTP